MDKSEIQENLVTLYLRLNGYFTTGFIIHSKENNKVDGELDIVAIRFPHHKQDDAEHNSSEYLEPQSTIDIIIGEVKSIGVNLQFNKCLKRQDTLESIEKILHWAGLFADQHITGIAKEINDLVQPQNNSQLKSFKSTKPIDTAFGKVVVRPILFSPERINVNNTDKFVTWTEINDFLWQCLCPEKERDLCKTRYDFDAWGQGLSEIVREYKDRQKVQKKFTQISELYQDIEAKEKTVKPV